MLEYTLKFMSTENPHLIDPREIDRPFHYDLSYTIESGLFKERPVIIDYRFAIVPDDIAGLTTILVLIVDNKLDVVRKKLLDKNNGLFTKSEKERPNGVSNLRFAFGAQTLLFIGNDYSLEYQTAESTRLERKFTISSTKPLLVVNTKDFNSARQTLQDFINPIS